MDKCIKIILLPDSQVRCIYKDGTEEIKEARPLLMKPWGIEATLEKRKTCTRRIIPINPLKYCSSELFYSNNKLYVKLYNGLTYSSYFPCKQGKPGDLLYLKESYTKLVEHYVEGMDNPYVYKQNMKEEDSERCRQDYIRAGYPYQWKSPLFMPREAAWIWLLIKDIRCKRLQDITKEDCIKEGAPWESYNIAGYDVFSWFQEEWDAINANRKDPKTKEILPYAWAHNPWVFPLDYELFFVGRGV